MLPHLIEYLTENVSMYNYLTHARAYISCILNLIFQICLHMIGAKKK